MRNLLPAVFLLLFSNLLFSQKDNVEVPNVFQEDSRITVRLKYNRTVEDGALGSNAQFATVLIKNNTADKLRVELEFYTVMVCGERLRVKIGFGSGIVIKPGETIGGGGFWDSDNTSFDAGNRRSKACMEGGSRNKKLADGKATAIETMGYDLIAIENISEKERNEAKAREEKRVKDSTDRANKLKEQDDKRKADSIAKADEKKKLDEKRKADSTVKANDQKKSEEKKKLDSANTAKASKASADSTKKADETAAKEEQAKKDAEAAAAEEQRRKEAAAEAERQRQARKAAYDEKIQQQNAANQELAAEMGIMMLMVHIEIGKRLYGTLDKCDDVQIKEEPARGIEAHVGYQVTSLPIFKNVIEESYDGNTYTYDSYLDNQTVTNIDLCANADFWPLRSAYAGYGMGAGISFGHGIESVNMQLNYGLRGYIGHKDFKLYGEYNGGTRNFRYNNWLNSQVASSGKLNGVYHQIKAGFRISGDYTWDIDDIRVNFDVLPIVEAHRAHYLPYGNNPKSIRWTNGLELALRYETKINAYFRCMWNFPVEGEREYPLGTTDDVKGTFVQFGVLRTFSFFAESDGGRSRDAEDNAVHSLYFASPGIEWFSGYNSEVFNYRPGLSFTPVAYQVDIPVAKKLAIETGFFPVVSGTSLGISPSFGGGNPFATGGFVPDNYYKYFQFRGEIPLVLKYCNNFSGAFRYWVSSGINNHLVFVKTTAISPLMYDDKFISQAGAGPESTSFRNSWRSGIGIDFLTGGTWCSSGIIYDRTFKDVFGIPGTALHSIKLLCGINF